MLYRAHILYVESCRQADHNPNHFLIHTEYREWITYTRWELKETQIAYGTEKLNSDEGAERKKKLNGRLGSKKHNVEKMNGKKYKALTEMGVTYTVRLDTKSEWRKVWPFASN